eukprot:2668584-Amphidinium_carterae.1
MAEQERAAREQVCKDLETKAQMHQREETLEAQVKIKESALAAKERGLDELLEMERMRIELEQKKAGEAHRVTETPSRNPIPSEQTNNKAGRIPRIAFPTRGTPHVSVGWKPSLQPVQSKKSGTVYSRKAKKDGGCEPPSSDSSSSSASSEKSEASKSSHHEDTDDTDESPLRKGAEVHNIATPRSPIP